MIKNISSFIKLKPVLAVGFLFASSSLLFGTWVAAIPGIKYRLGFTDASLGLSLLLSPLGALTGVALSTKLFGRIPVGRWMFLGYVSLGVIMILQINSVNRVMFWICLYLFGMNSFLNGVSVNTTVGFLEKQFKRRMMSTCHGMYSLGGGISAGLATIFFALSLSPRLQIVLVAATICIVIYFNRKYLLAHQRIIHSGSGLKFPSLSILSISFLCMVLFMAEGCVADWSAIYLRESLHGTKEIMGLGYAGFSAAMTIGRLNGDSIITKFGSKKVVIAGALLAATGFTIVVSGTTCFNCHCRLYFNWIRVLLYCSCIIQYIWKNPQCKSCGRFCHGDHRRIDRFSYGPFIDRHHIRKTRPFCRIIIVNFVDACCRGCCLEK